MAKGISLVSFLIVAIGILFGVLYGLTIPTSRPLAIDESFSTYRAQTVLLNPELPLDEEKISSSLGIKKPKQMGRIEYSEDRDSEDSDSEDRDRDRGDSDSEDRGDSDNEDEDNEDSDF
jgi:hypothetical protein